MSLPLGPALANLFVDFYEEKLFSQIAKPQVFFRYVDDTFVIFHHEAERSEFLTMLNNFQPSLKFTFEKELENNFLLLTSVLRSVITYLKQKSTGNSPLQDNTSDKNLFV